MDAQLSCTWKQAYPTARGHSSQKTGLSESQTLRQSWNCIQGSSVHSHWLYFPRHTWGDCEPHISPCLVEESWGFSPPSTHIRAFSVNKSLLLTLKKPPS